MMRLLRLSLFVLFCLAFHNLSHAQLLGMSDDKFITWMLPGPGGLPMQYEFPVAIGNFNPKKQLASFDFCLTCDGLQIITVNGVSELFFQTHAHIVQDGQDFGLCADGCTYGPAQFYDSNGNLGAAVTITEEQLLGGASVYKLEGTLQGQFVCGAPLCEGLQDGGWNRSLMARFHAETVPAMTKGYIPSLGGLDVIVEYNW